MMFLEPKFTTNQLIDRCIAGERKAQELLYKQFAGKMLAVCMRYATDRMEAEDMLQNGFIKMFQKISNYRSDGSFEGWVRCIMVHSSIEYCRKHHKMLQVIDIDEGGPELAVDPLASSNLGAGVLIKLIQQLAPGYRMVFNLYALEGYSHKEIAGMVGISEGASKSQLSRARSILKEQIAKMEGTSYGYAG